MARPRDNADLLSGGKKIEIESGIDSGLTVVDESGRKVFEVLEDGKIYQDHEAGSDNENGVILLSDEAGIRVNDFGVLEITQDGGYTWYTCCEIPDDLPPPVVDPCGENPLTFQDAHDASLLIAAGGGLAAVGSNTSAMINNKGKLFTCGVRQADRYGKPTQNYNDVAVPLQTYYDSYDCGFKDKFSEINRTGTLPEDYEAKMVRCTSTYASTGYSAGMTMILTADNEIWSIGYNYYGSRGTSVTTSSQVWEREALGFEWTYFDVGFKCTYAIKSDGTLWSAGRYDPLNTINDSAAYSTFTRVGNDSDWKTVSVSHDGGVIFALKTNGTLWSWGATSGALGRYAYTTSHGKTIAQVGEDNDWIHVSVGGAYNYQHFVALKSDGTLWGGGHHGENITYYNKGETSSLAGGSNFKPTVNSRAPNEEPYVMQLGYESDWVFCAAGVGKTYGLKCTGDMWATGENGFFELGVGGADRDNRGREIPNGEDGRSLRDFADGSRYGFYGHLSSISSFVEEMTKRREWLTVSAGNNHTIGFDRDMVLYGAGNNKIKFSTDSRYNYGFFGTSMGLDVKSQDRFVPLEFGDTDYSQVPVAKSTVTRPTTPTAEQPEQPEVPEPPKTKKLVAPDYKCAYVSPGWMYEAKAGKWPKHVGPDPKSDCAKSAQAKAPVYEYV